MNEVLYMVLAFISGLALGAVFFGGLWLTVKKAVNTKLPALWIFSSFFIRMGITLTGFYFISSGSLKRLLICLAGFIVARFLVIHVTKTIQERRLPVEKEGHYES